MVTVTGDFKKLNRMIVCLGEMGGGLFGNSWLGSVRGLIAVRVEGLVSQSFSLRASPYGMPWKPSKRPSAGDLVETGRLRGSLRIKATREGITVSSAVPYALVHQEGAKTNRGRIPARPFLPDRESWPSSWSSAFESEFVGALDSLWMRV